MKHILFSKRKELAKKAESWCKEKNTSLNTVNFVTALNAIGALKLPENENSVIDGSILQLKDYDPGLLNDHGGGDVDWWLNYIRAEVNRCNEYWREALESHIIHE